MRVVAGTLGGRKLVAPVERSVRPTTERVREAVFNVLTSMGAVQGSTAVDLFAGTGAMGIEALSRGAASVVFVENDPMTVRALRTNLSALGLGQPAAFDKPAALGHEGEDAEPVATVVKSDARRWIRDRRQANDYFDIAFCDPPYSFVDWQEMLRDFPAALLVAESAATAELGPKWEVLRSKRYGTTVVTLAKRCEHEEGSP